MFSAADVRSVASTLFSAADVRSVASTLFSAFASFVAFVVLVRSLAKDLVPSPVWSYLDSYIDYLFTPLSNQLTIVVDEDCGISRNQVYDAAEAYFRTKINPNAKRLNVSRTPKQKTLHVGNDKGEEVSDQFKNIDLTWRLVEPQKHHSDEKRFFELSFHKRFKDRVLNEYLPRVVASHEEIEEQDKILKLYTGDGGAWDSINLDHPATFETLALEPKLKKDIIDDLERFRGRREFYKRVGKAWKRGYLLYGPPGTGKSSLIAAIANYLKFDIYDLELTSFYSNSELRRILVSTTNRSIIVIEDIDCSVQMQDRQTKGDQESSDTKLTLSGLLNVIDGLWSSCGDERIIIFTTNHKDRIDPALLRPGRMDMHVHMSYCSGNVFKILASNYLSAVDDHPLFGQIERLIKGVEVTPAEVAEELMRSEDADVALPGVMALLKRKKVEASEVMKTEGIL